jgi:para-nitrobenzyl esterase
MIASLLLTAALAGASPVVATDAGRVRGEALADGRSLFRGIPFAAPPLGPLRWRAPERPARWADVRDATRPAPSCPQIDYGWNHEAAVDQSEDCLYLDVATPSLAPERPLPVMVWIHGGGNRAGGAGGTVTSPIVRQGIVLVSLQYRLSALGFLSHPALGAHSGNYGLMDQQAALRWVKANIARFGGDPKNVTIFGESAGAQDVGLQMLSPGAQGLFARAIEESGTPGFGLPPRSLWENQRVGAMILTKAGAPVGADAARLRALPAKALIEASETTDVPGLDDDSFIWLQAVVDGVVLRDTPASLLARGVGSDIPLILGNNSDELGLHGPVRRAIEAGFGPYAAAAAKLYGLPSPHAETERLRLQIANDLTFRCPSLHVAGLRSASGGKSWHYQFSVPGPDGKPVTHGSEIRFVLWADGDEHGATAPLDAYWVNFARAGDPNGTGLPAWPGFAPDTSTLELTAGGPRIIHNLSRSICSLRAMP